MTVRWAGQHHMKKWFLVIKLFQICFSGISRLRQYYSSHCRHCVLRSIIIIIIILIIAFLIFVSQPKFIFQSYLHIPWLTNVRHVKSLVVVLPMLINLVGHARVVHSSENFQLNDDHLTIIILTAQSDFKRTTATHHDFTHMPF